MSSTIRRRFEALHRQMGTAGVVLAALALLLCTAGGALAASGALTGKQKKEVKKIAKQYAGKPGAPGVAGPAGAPGAPGKEGAQGKAGLQGEVGPTGEQGPTGEVGPTGPTGETGFTETLPSEKTEKGVWRFASNGETLQYVPITFSIPLSEADAASIAVETLSKTASPTANCPGSPKEPRAEPGFLCVYTSGDESQTTFFGSPNAVYKPVSSGEEEGVISGGALLYFESHIIAGEVSAGSFAVTAP